MPCFQLNQSLQLSLFIQVLIEFSKPGQNQTAIIKLAVDAGILEAPDSSAKPSESF